MDSKNQMQAQQATRAIKQLLTVNEKLNKDLDNAVTEKQQIMEELCLLKKKYNDLITKEVQVSSQEAAHSIASPIVESKLTETEQLIEVNLSLRKKLEEHHSPAEIKDFADEQEFQMVIQQYRDIVKKKDDEIVFYKNQCSQSHLMNKVYEMKKLLQRNCAVNDAYVVEINSLHAKMASLGAGSYESLREEGSELTEVQAASGDQDLSPSANLANDVTPARSGRDDEVERMKGEINELNQSLQHATSRWQDVQIKLDESTANSLYLKDEVEKLKAELQRVDQRYKNESDFDRAFKLEQWKVFEDDFNEERKEKEKKLEENERLKGENSHLKDKLDKLTALVQSQQIQQFQSSQETYNTVGKLGPQQSQPNTYDVPQSQVAMRTSYQPGRQQPAYQQDQPRAGESSSYAAYPPTQNTSNNGRDLRRLGYGISIPPDSSAYSSGRNPPPQTAPVQHHSRENEFPYTTQHSVPSYRTPRMPINQQGRLQADSQSFEDSADTPLESPKTPEQN